MPAAMSRRFHCLSVFLSVFALIGQLLLPVVHAQARVQHGGDALLYAYCGEVAPQVAAALRQQLAGSAAAADFDRQQPVSSDLRLADLTCSSCASVHAAQLASAPPAGIALSLRRVEAPAAPAALAYAVSHQLRLPPAQAPPRST